MALLRRQTIFMDCKMVRNELKFPKVNLAQIAQYEKRINDEALSGEIGYYFLPQLGESVICETQEFLNGKEFNEILIVGIGGSSLGVRAMFEMLSAKKSALGVHFLDNLDAFSYINSTANLDKNKTLFVISSKSGSTIETISLFKCVIKEFKISDFSSNFIFITDENSVLQKFAQNLGAKVINIPQNVGGRFSVLSAVGLVPLVACGYDVRSLLRGASDCKMKFFDGKDSKNDEIWQKAYHYATHRTAKINVVFSYCDRLHKFNDWYVQLWAESLGKKRDYKRVGLTPVGLIGSTDQHSFLQLIVDGPKDKTITFIKVKNHGKNVKIPPLNLDFLQDTNYTNGFSLNEVINHQCDATMKVLQNEGLSVDLIEIDELDEYSVGFLLYYYELLTSFTGSMLGINTYNQPGVEIGKLILKTTLSNL